MKKIALSLGTIAFVAAASIAASGAFFTDTAQATGNVFSSGTLSLQLAQDNNGAAGSWTTGNISTGWNFPTMAPGATPSLSYVWLKNNGSIDSMHLGVALTKANDGGTGLESQIRITKLMLGYTNLLTGGAGASIDDYVAPTGCTVTVDPSGTPSRISAALSSATTGSVICVKPGDYNSGWESASQLTIGTPSVTLVSLAGPDTTTIPLPIVVSAAGVTVRGFGISNPNGSFGVEVNGVGGASVLDNKISNVGTNTSLTGSAQGVYLAGGAGVTGFTVKGNIISNIGNTSLVQGTASGSSAKGIYIGDTSGTGTIAGVDIENNFIDTVKASPAPWPDGANATQKQTVGRGAYGVLINYGTLGNSSYPGVTSAPVIKNNTISNLDGLWATAIGLEGRTTGATRVTYNDISNLVNHKPVNDSNGVKVEDNSGTDIVINNNNFAPNVAYGVVQTTKSARGGAAINATNNWWGDFTPSNHIASADSTAYVNAASPANGPIAGLVAGVDQNANNYADMQDLRLTTITNSPVTLNAGASKRLVMGVQLDGPSTIDHFQGKSLTTDVRFTLSQQ